MKLQPERIPDLQAQLAAIDALQAKREAFEPQIAAANAAAARLTEQIGELDVQAKKAGEIVIPAAGDRVAKLIAGAAVEQPDASAVEIAAKSAHHIGAKKQQAAEDLAAVRAHMASLTSAAAAAERAVASAKATLLERLGEAIVEAFKRDAMEFVDTYVPHLHTLARRLRIAKGAAPDWETWLFGGLKILWAADEVTQQTPHHQPTRELSVLWPRVGDTLLSGKPVISEALIDDLLEAIRTSPVSNASPISDGMSQGADDGEGSRQSGKPPDTAKT